MQHGMPTDDYIAMAMPQLKAGQFFVVSHAYNMERITQRYEMLKAAFETYAPRYEGDQQYDVRTVIKPVLEQHLGVKLRELK